MTSLSHTEIDDQIPIDVHLIVSVSIKQCVKRLPDLSRVASLWTQLAPNSVDGCGVLLMLQH